MHFRTLAAVLILSTSPALFSAEVEPGAFIVNPWETPYGMPPFGRLPHDEFLAAYEQAAAMQNAAIDQILKNPGPPTFENTIEPYERSRSTLYRVLRAFIPITKAIADDNLRAASKEIFPAFAAHEEAIFLNRGIFDRIDYLYERRNKLDLAPDQVRLIELIHLEFVKYGVGVPDSSKSRLEAVSAEIAELGQQFQANNREESNAYEILIQDPASLGDMPQSMVDAAAARAGENGHDCECWSFSLSRSTADPFLKFVRDRALRKQFYEAYYALGTNDNEWNNVAIVNRVLSLRAERAKLLGYATYADFRTAYSMSETPDNVRALLDELWRPAKSKVAAIEEILEARMHEDGVSGRLEAWDWQYYAELVKAEEYAVSEGTLNAYFPLNRVRDGAFDMANRLFGLRFKSRPDLPRWHPDQEVYEVFDGTDEHLGIVLFDWYSRDNKINGAWTDEIRVAEKMDGPVSAIAGCTFNFAKGDGRTPALLSQQDGATLFHEFGHALHTLLSTQTYVRLSGFNYWPRDAVEFPSQVMEYWFYDPDFMRSFAKHYETGESIPRAMSDKILEADAIDKGYLALRLIAASYLDLAMHSITEDQPVDVLALQENLFDSLELPSYVDPLYRAPFFLHSISGGYESTYYGYLWSDIMAADAFGAFREHGLFDEETAEAFRRYIFESGASRPQLELFEAFRGRRPSSSALIREMGLD